MRHRRGDRAIGIFLGILLGLAIVTAFVFLGGQTIDSPELEEGPGTAPQQQSIPAPGGP